MRGLLALPLQCLRSSTFEGAYITHFGTQTPPAEQTDLIYT